MKKLFRNVALTLAILIGLTSLAAPAQAYNSWYWDSISCDWIYTYYTVDYDWWEEVFQGKHDYTIYIGSRYQYNYYCHNIRFS